MLAARQKEHREPENPIFITDVNPSTLILQRLQKLAVAITVLYMYSTVQLFMNMFI